MSEPALEFDGRAVPFREGQTIAAALTEAGQRAFRRTAKDAPRGIFCGMGVCQDCLVTVDGVPNRRACMTKARAGQRVTTGEPFPALDLDARLPEPAPARVLEPEVLVIGGGAGGLSAAIAARAAGAKVVLVDERPVPGGQYYKQAASGAPLDAQQSEGAALVAAARESGAELLGGVEIWGAFDGPLFLAEQDGAALILRPKTVIVATGAYERPVMVPGWTLPGVMTTGAAQTLWRSYRTLPGRRVVVCGSGPLNAQVALELAEGGAEVACVAELAPMPFGKPFAAARMALADPALTLKGFGLLRGLRRRGIALRYGTALRGIEAADGGLAVTLADRRDGSRVVEVDAVCMNAGFEPQNEILRLLGAQMTYDAVFGHLRCTRSETLETSVPGVYAVGDCAGMGGAPAARVEGRIAGRAAAAATGHGEAYDLFAELRTLARHRRFQRGLWRLYDVRPRPPEPGQGETILCRCEEVSLAEATEGHGRNPGHVGTLKRGTRIGMGRCQGRYCGPVATRLVAGWSGAEIADRSFFAPRVPIKPVSIASILAAQEALDDAP
ncbi:FAD-dependent oxidoreductase [Jannaschia seohaensis]|uniref:Pyruvate/2-oxoglutarate dehydrogenase complex dihydrolipoamide dehydrogenase (E3) component n=1 Tax=Jannaschia seohaensis TaxID=475081 RepID=A0A2Y9C8A2_9RHOB|nr:FAD-dependent oxidoreductase [Jannaschia seohaensis]PWJ17046.1 pyruvate/2-oxoglutarate dehydrogenase complex dihydrolipoamide dehydrogenase (E3) component [Jannaschia seohaensis]SSA48383.1 Pyruvate/2-oxoglutarate dehydrogenase complex, dihydrolipoamide dehydrogenase (E3) component [Jannaschia seohaensis]